LETLFLTLPQGRVHVYSIGGSGIGGWVRLGVSQGAGPK
jgi:hypothetical protein